MSDFRKKWGNRANEDFWRISNKQNLMAKDDSEGGYDYGDDEAGVMEAGDSTMTGGMEELNDSLANDPHNREYYLKQIPFTEDQLAESNAQLCNGLYNAGILEQEKLEDFPLAEKTMLRLIADFPEHEEMDNVCYHMFLLYGRMGQPEQAEHYRTLLLEQYADSKLAQLIGNPRYEMISRNGKHIEDSVYQAACEADQAED